MSKIVAFDLHRKDYRCGLTDVGVSGGGGTTVPVLGVLLLG